MVKEECNWLLGESAPRLRSLRPRRCRARPRKSNSTAYVRFQNPSTSDDVGSGLFSAKECVLGCPCLDSGSNAKSGSQKTLTLLGRVYTNVREFRKLTIQTQLTLLFTLHPHYQNWIFDLDVQSVHQRSIDSTLAVCVRSALVNLWWSDHQLTARHSETRSV